MSDFELINQFTQYQLLKKGDTAGVSYSIHLKEVDNNIANVNGKLLILDGQEETYNQMYLNAKENPTNFSLFSKIGLRTTQDWVLAYFYFSYILFSVLLIITAVKQYEQKTMMGLMFFAIFFVIGVLATAAITAYA